jgi:hypothetical protein
MGNRAYQVEHRLRSSRHAALIAAKEEDQLDGNVSSRRTIRRTRRGWLMAAAAMTTLLLVTACGGGAKHNAGGSNGSGQISVQALDKFAACMRRNGVLNFYFAPSGSSPASNDELSLRGYLVPGVGPHTPNFSSAMKACRSVNPIPMPGPASRQQFDSLLHQAECMRTHGFPAFPDPAEVNGRLAVQPLPSSIDQNSPQFLKAQQTCGA